MFKNSQYQLWHANAGARRNLNRSLKAPMSGDPKYNIHANDIDFQIESDFIGLMTPGLPREANKYADRVGRVMNWGDGFTPTEIEIPFQEPQAPALEQWDIGVPLKRVEVTDPAWTFKGKFEDRSSKFPWGGELKFKEARAAGNEATLTFEGTGVAIVGRCTQEGGRADVFLDGEKAAEIDAWIPKNATDDDYWDVSGLPAGKHSVRVLVRADADARSKGHKIHGPLSIALRLHHDPNGFSRHAGISHAVVLPPIFWLRCPICEDAVGGGRRLDTLAVTFNGVTQTYDFRYQSPVPEPTSLLLLGTGVVGAGWRKYRAAKKRRRHSFQPHGGVIPQLP